MRSMRILFLLTCVLFFAKPAMAGNPPAPAMIVAWFSLLPMMMVLTSVGGGYVIIKAKERHERKDEKTDLPKRKISIGNIFLILLMPFVILFSAAQEGGAFLVLVCFGLYALCRSFMMIVWAIRTTLPNRPEYLATAHPVRLLASASLIVVVTVLLIGLGYASILAQNLYEYCPTTEHILSDFVAFQLAFAEWQQEQTGNGEFALMIVSDYLGRQVVELTFSEDLDAFTLHMLTSNVIAPWPYNYVFPQTAYRVDETGKVRKVKVTNIKQRCPEDAPVASWAVEKTRVADHLKAMRQGRFFLPSGFRFGRAYPGVD